MSNRNGYFRNLRSLDGSRGVVTFMVVTFAMIVGSVLSHRDSFTKQINLSEGFDTTMSLFGDVFSSGWSSIVFLIVTVAIGAALFRAAMIIAANDYYGDKSKMRAHATGLLVSVVFVVLLALTGVSLGWFNTISWTSLINLSLFLAVPVIAAFTVATCWNADKDSVKLATGTSVRVESNDAVVI